MNSGRNWGDVIFRALLYWLRDLDNKTIEAEVFGELRNLMLEENGEDKMARESN